MLVTDGPTDTEGDPAETATVGADPTGLAAVRRRPRARQLLVVALVVALVGGFALAVGPRRVASELAGLDPRWFAAAVAASLLSLAIWSEAQRALFTAAGATVPASRFLLAYAVGNFAKRTLPGGRLGAPAVMAYALGRETTIPYERGLTAVVIGYTVGFPAAIVVPVAAVPLVATTGATSAAPRLVALLVAIAAVALGLGGLVAARPGPPTRLLHALATAGRATVGRLSARADAALARERIDRAIADVGETARAIGRSWTALAVTFLLTVAGWVAGALALSAILVSLGHPAAPAVAVLAVPLSALGNVVPLPAGLGGVDATLATVLVATLGLDLVAAGVVVLAYRLASDGVFVLVGGLVVAGRAAVGGDPADG